MNEPGGVYLTLKIAAQLFAKPFEALAADELRRVSNVAMRQQEIETLILAAPEAAGVTLPEASIAAGLEEIRGRYASEADYHADLDRVGLDVAALRQAVLRDMRVEALLEKVGARAPAVSATEVEIFWFMHQERFRRAETRVLRHILITISEQLAGNERDAARGTIEAIRARLLKNPERFAEQALKHSECPTAMNGGLLGNVPRGQLYPELEAAAFALPAAALSEPVESELGWHLILCETINAERQSQLAEVRQTIRDHLQQQRRSICQKSWINSLRRKPPTSALTIPD
ncbi:MAG: nitrogen fixation protein NifM [Sulfuritalea sp.]|nr:nitrogen fixation protein NifM [Sulfuritalea sp.]